MTMIEFCEGVCGFKLRDYQKRLLNYIQEHPDYTIKISRGCSCTDRMIPLFYAKALYHSINTSYNENKGGKNETTRII